MRQTVMTAGLLLSVLTGVGVGHAHNVTPEPVGVRAIVRAAERARAEVAPERAALAATIRAAVQAETRRLAALVGKHRRAADPEGRRAAWRQLVRTAAAREERLAALVAEQPEAALAAAMTPEERAALPAEVQGLVEEHVAVEGELEVIHEDNDRGGRYLHTLRTPDAALTVHFAGLAPELQTGDRVQVRGLRVRRALAVGTEADAVVLAAAAPVANTFGAQATLVMMVAFQNQPTVTAGTVASMRSTVFGETNSVSRLVYQSSYGQTWLTGDVVGPFVVAQNSSTCNYSAIGNAADSAASKQGIKLANYPRRVYVFPYSSACGWAGLGTVGGSPSRAWINGGGLGTILHELGHNFGLYHSHALECGDVAYGGKCSSIEYGDTVDVMGSGGSSQFNAAQKERLGWLGWQQSPPITTVTATGTYTLDPYETMTQEPKALKIALGNGDFYYVEYRPQIVNITNLNDGVVVHFVDGGNPNAIYLLDMTPATSSWWDPALAVGQVYTDPAAKVSIAPLWVNGQAAAVHVTVGGGGSACVRRAPTVTVTPATQQGAPGSRVSYTIAVTNNDSACGPATFRPQVAVPAGWSAAFAAATLSIASGATQSTTLEVTSPSTVVAGTYTVSPAAVHEAQSTYAAVATATYAVVGSGGGAAGQFVDNFDRADSTALGANWLEVSGDFAIQGGQLVSAATKAKHLAVAPGAAGRTQDVSVKFTASEAKGGAFGVIARYQDAGNYYVCYRETGATSRLRIARVAGGTATVLATASVANPAKNASFTLGCSVEGAQITLEYNGAVRAKATDPTFASGSAGLMIDTTGGVGSASHRADGFTATSR